MPAIAFRPIVERNSLALLPDAHGGVRPALPCRSAQAVGASAPNVFMSRSLSVPPPPFARIARIRVDRLNRIVPYVPEFKQPLLVPDNVLLSCLVLRVERSRKIETGECVKVGLGSVRSNTSRCRPTDL